jgi:VWFA-related protein
MLSGVPNGFAAALLSLTLCAPIAHGQTDLSAWPQVSAGIFVTNAKGGSLTGLTADAFLVKENGRPQTVTSLSTITEPQSVCVLIDTSGSMFQRTAIVMSAASRFIEKLPAEDEVCVATFAFRLKMEQGLTTDRSRALTAVSHAGWANGGSTIYDSVAQLANYMQNSSRFDSRAILLLSDGVDNASNGSPNQDAFDRLRVQLERNRSSVLHIIRIATDDNENWGEKRSAEKAVMAMTAIGGGLPYFPRNQRDLDADVDDLSQAMKTRTMLVYTSDNPAKDGQARHVEVVVDKAHGGKKLKVRAPEGYYVPSE